MLALGQLYLDNGQGDGQKTIPADWVRQVTAPHADVTGLPGTDAYGYQWWPTTADHHPADFAWGFGGQLIEIVPDLTLAVVVSTEPPVFGTAPPAQPCQHRHRPTATDAP